MHNTISYSNLAETWVNHRSLWTALKQDIQYLVEWIPTIQWEYRNKPAYVLALTDAVVEKISNMYPEAHEESRRLLADAIVMIIDPLIVESSWSFNIDSSKMGEIESSIVGSLDQLITASGNNNSQHGAQMMRSVLSVLRSDMEGKFQRWIEHDRDPNFREKKWRAGEIVTHALEASLVSASFGLQTWAVQGFIDGHLQNGATNNLNEPWLTELAQSSLRFGPEYLTAGWVSAVLTYLIWKWAQNMRKNLHEWRGVLSSSKGILGATALSLAFITTVDIPWLMIRDSMVPILHHTAGSAHDSLSKWMQSLRTRVETGTTKLVNWAHDYSERVLKHEEDNYYGAWKWSAWVAKYTLKQSPEAALLDPRLADERMRAAVVAAKWKLDISLERNHPGLEWKAKIVSEEVVTFLSELDTTIAWLNSLNTDWDFTSIELKQSIDRIKEKIVGTKQKLRTTDDLWKVRRTIYETLIAEIDTIANAKYGRPSTDGISMDFPDVDFDELESIIGSIKIPEARGVSPFEAWDRLKSVIDIPHGISHGKYLVILLWIIIRLVGFEWLNAWILTIRSGSAIRSIKKNSNQHPTKLRADLDTLISQVVDSLVEISWRKQDDTPGISKPHARLLLMKQLVAIEPALQWITHISSSDHKQKRTVVETISGVRKRFTSSLLWRVLFMNARTEDELYNKYVYSAMRKLFWVEDASVPLTWTLHISPIHAQELIEAIFPQPTLDESSSSKMPLALLLDEIRQISKWINQNNARIAVEIRKTTAFEAKNTKALEKRMRDLSDWKVGSFSDMDKQLQAYMRSNWATLPIDSPILIVIELCREFGRVFQVKPDLDNITRLEQLRENIEKHISQLRDTWILV